MTSTATPTPPQYNSVTHLMYMRKTHRASAPKLHPRSANELSVVAFDAVKHKSFTDKVNNTEATCALLLREMSRLIKGFF